MFLPKFKQIEKLAIDNSPIILTVIGVVGTIGTALLTHKAATMAERVLVDELDNRMATNAQDAWLKRDRIKLVWKLYIPPVVSGTLTVAAIVGANHIGSKRTAAVAAAYTISEKAFSEYREKVMEKIGEAKSNAIQDDIASDQLARTPMTEKNVVIMGSGDVLCFDQWSGRYFNSSVEEIKKAVNEVNYMVTHNGYASLTDFYNQINLPRTQESEEIGWTADKLLEAHFSASIAEDGRPCVAYQFQVHPVRGYHNHI